MTLKPLQPRYYIVEGLAFRTPRSLANGASFNRSAALHAEVYREKVVPWSCLELGVAR